MLVCANFVKDVSCIDVSYMLSESFWLIVAYVLTILQEPYPVFYRLYLLQKVLFTPPISKKLDPLI